jgi:serine phosphatase RsbU (regulator of sigma subunit)
VPAREPKARISFLMAVDREALATDGGLGRGAVAPTPKDSTSAAQAQAGEGSSSTRLHFHRPPWPSRTAAAAFAIGALVTAALSLTSLAVYNRNERRLLNLRLRELNLVLAATAPAVQTPLASAAELANATGGSAQKFRAFMTPYVGRGRPFTSVSLWPLGTSHLAPTAVLGVRPLLASKPSRARKVFGGAGKPGVLNITGILGPAARPILGFEFHAPGTARAFAVYAENPLPANRRSTLERNAAFSDLDYALYLGRSRRTKDLLVTSEKSLPITGRRASGTVPFGSAVLTLVIAARGSLGGTFFKNLPWIIGLVGLLVALAAALMTERLARRRQRAEQLAGILDRVAAENREMYTEQRSIAQTLQHALLPETLPELAGLRANALYVPAASGVDVGGDWYDLIEVGERKMFLVIGDVSGHGLRAATIMALLRHATLAYVAQDPHPASVLEKLSDFVDGTNHDYFATVLCALIDVDAHALTVASAGHMAPLLVHGQDGSFVDFDPNVPIGVTRSGAFEEATLSIPPDSTLLAFTDGLVERRGEVLDVGLARLRDFAISHPLPLETLLERLASELTSEDHHDDTAIVGIQWLN